MRSELLRELQSVGWEEVYGRHLNLSGTPNQKGEIRLTSPFPYLRDRRPSFSLNVTTGLWYCFIQGKGGDYVMFRALMETEEFDPISGFGIPDYEAVQRKLLQEFGVTKALDSNWLRSCQETLLSDPTLMWSIQQQKPWEISNLSQMGIGYDNDTERFVIPIYDRKGAIVNAKLYSPASSSGPKMIWGISGIGGNYLYPSRAWTEPWVVLVEGETDVISMRSYGFPACSGTAGAGDPVPEGDWWRGKTVFVLMDSDDAGIQACEKAIYRMRELAASVVKVELPDWPGKPEKADSSDYIQYLKAQGYDSIAIQSALGTVLENGERLQGSDSTLDAEPVDCLFSQALSSSNLNGKVRFKARVLARSSNRYMLPIEYEVRCPGTGQQWCRRCPMSQVHHGIGRFRHDHRRQESLRLIQCTANIQVQEIKAIQGIARQCPEPILNAINSKDVEVCMIGESTHDATGNSHERARREAYFILGSKGLEENRDYELEAYVYAHPKTQQAVFLVTNYKPLANAFEGYHVDATSIDSLSIFQPGKDQDPFDKIMEICFDLSESVTLIKGRPDLHAAYRSVFHSVLQFNLGGEFVKRGWLEALVIGDTRCGKSKAYQLMSEHYGVGTLVDCKMQSIAGILGSVQQAPSGEFYALAGLLPQNDGGIVCFDEFAARTHKTDFVGALSSTRAEGVVRINKAASGEFKARVRAIWLANPGLGELMAELPDMGCEIIPRVITQPEDIARFDFALTVSQLEVPVSSVNKIHDMPPAKYNSEVSKELIRWVYSRSTEQIIFTDEALQYLPTVSKWLSEKYDPSIPIVEINDQKTRVAKLSVSVASQLFSTDNGENIIVKPEHIMTAAKLLCLWYDKPSMGYDVYSNSIRQQKLIRNEEDLRAAFDVTISPYGHRLAEILLKMDEINPRDFRSYIPMNGMYAESFVGRLNANNCLKPTDRGRRGTYKKTPDFTRWLKEYLGHIF